MTPCVEKHTHHHPAKLAFVFITINAVVWWLLFSIGRSSLDTYGDMAEAYAWGINWQWGYDKHPPLSAWTAAAWFQLFPTADWAYYLLAMLNQGLAFWFVFLAGRRWMPATNALLAVMITSLIPLFGPDTGFKFNANSAMLPWVALYAWSLIVALQTKSFRFAILAGVAAGLACLVKYWAPLLLVAITLGALLITTHDRSLRWGAAIKRMMAVSGVMLLFFLPHLSWAVSHHWPGLRYAYASHAIGSVVSSSNLDLLVDLSLVALLPTLAWLLSLAYARFSTAWPSRGSEIAGWSGRPAARPLIGASIFTFALAFTLASAHHAGVAVASKWLIPAWLFFSWVLCCTLPAKLQAQRLLRPLATLIGLYWIGLFCYVFSINPSLSIVRDAANQRHTVAREITEKFHDLFGSPLRFVAGDEALSFSTSFYSLDHPVAIANLDFNRTSWVDEADVRKAGLVVLCDEPQASCFDNAMQRLGPPRASSVWTGLTDDGQATQVQELFYPPNQG